MVVGEPDFLPKLFLLLDHNKKPVRREALWTISNVTSGDAELTEAVIGNKKYLEALFEIVDNEGVEVRLCK